MNVYENCPIFVTKRFTMRLVKMEDAPGLLKVYSDRQAQMCFNSDNCTSDFRYATLQEMEECIAMWLWSYRQGHFVRWTILDAQQTPVGTVEMFRRDDGDDGRGCGVLRLDLLSNLENAHILSELLRALLPSLHELFGCGRILTKALPCMEQRRLALVLLGFYPCREPLIGHGGIALPHYWGRRHMPG